MVALAMLMAILSCVLAGGIVVLASWCGHLNHSQVICASC
jgi:hypothetical protein